MKLFLLSILFLSIPLFSKAQIAADTMTAGDHLIRSTNRKYISWGLTAASMGVFYLGSNDPVSNDFPKYVGGVLLFGAAVSYVGSVLDIRTAGRKLNGAYLTPSNNGLGLALRF